MEKPSEAAKRLVGESVPPPPLPPQAVPPVPPPIPQSAMPPPPPPVAPNSVASPTPTRPVPSGAAPRAPSAVAPSALRNNLGMQAAPSEAAVSKARSVQHVGGKSKKVARRAPAAKQLSETEQRRRKAPSWLSSLVVHLVLLLVLALVPLRQIAQGPITFFLGASAGTIDSEFELRAVDAQAEMLETTDTSPQETPDATEPLKALEIPDIPAVVDLPTTLTSAETLESLPVGIVDGLSGRQGNMKQQLLAKFGGNAATEEAVTMGLAWLARNQNSDGSWSLLGPYSNGGALENKTAATAMALNAFLGAGHTHLAGEYRENMTLGIAYLLKRQDREGFFADSEPSRQQMYAQAIASICIIEAFGLTKDTKLLGPAQSALKFAEWSQSSLRGWRYSPREDADTSVTGWYVMVLATGKMAGLKVDDDKFNSISVFLDSVSHEDYSRYSYTEMRPPSLSMTAEGMLCRLYLGWSNTNPALLAAIEDDLLPNSPLDDGQEFSVYYWYYATQVLHHVGGRLWEEWNNDMKRTLPAMQAKAGAERGSWNPQRDIYGSSGGRLYVTCLNLYCLGVY